MPATSVTSFIPCAVGEWIGFASSKPAAPKKLTPGRKGKPKPNHKPKRKKAKRFTPQRRAVLIDRLEAAIESGLIDLNDEDMPCESLDFTLAELALLMRIFLPEEYIDPSEANPRPPATRTAPGSAERIAEYAFRLAQKRALFTAGDATAHKAHDPGLRIEQRGNGTGVKVVGWADERDEEEERE